MRSAREALALADTETAARCAAAARCQSKHALNCVRLAELSRLEVAL
jgi:hypothetical protein